MRTGKEERRMWVPVVEPVRKDLPEGEIGRLSHEHVYVMAENEEFIVVRARADQIPNCLYEIGRQRETVAREIGEGTGRGLDLDHFDLYYMHFVVWDKRRGEIAGAFRAGQADIILKRFGQSGLCTGTMFDFSPLFLLKVGAALEIGKFFIRAEYRKRYVPISLLCKGLGYYISYNPHYKVLIGSASVSRRYSPLSAELMFSFLKRYRCVDERARLVHPIISALNDEPSKGEGASASCMYVRDLSGLSKLISGVEPDGKGIPLYLKHYLKLGGKVIGFSIEPSFDRTLNSLILLDIGGCNQGALKYWMGKEGMERFLEYHDLGQDCAA